MTDQSYRSFLKSLEDEGELLVVNRQVDPETNLSAIEWKTYYELNKSTLFTDIKGHPGWRACSQIVADRKKWAIGLGMPEDEVLTRLSALSSQPVPSESVDPKGAPVREVVLTGDEAKLTDIPAVIVSERDVGRYIPSGISFVRDPDTGIQNMSLHRMQVKGAGRSGFVMLPRHARKIYDKYCARGDAMPVSVVIGVHPAIWFSSAFTSQFGFDELELAGALLGEPVRTIKSETSDIQVPAEAEIVLEGEIVGEGFLEDEGPFGEVTGTYPDPDVAHVFRLKAITRRKDPIYYALHCGFPPTDTQSTTGLGIDVATVKHLERVDGGLDLLDVRTMTVSGLLALVIKLRPKSAGQAKVALMAALSGPYQQPKLAIAVDEDIDAGDLRQVMWSMATRVNATDDVITIPNVKTWGLDNASTIVPGVQGYQRLGTRWMIDATKPPVTMPDQRARFDMAMPKGFAQVDLRDFLDPKDI
ncbi:UbiD family decarboxylase [Amorphus sp. MBR-141]